MLKKRIGRITKVLMTIATSLAIADPSFAKNEVCVNGGSSGISIRGQNKEVVSKVPIGVRWCGVANFE